MNQPLSLFMTNIRYLYMSNAVVASEEAPLQGARRFEAQRWCRGRRLSVGGGNHRRFHIKWSPILYLNTCKTCKYAKIYVHVYITRMKDTPRIQVLEDSGVLHGVEVNWT
jgi:hypothetical protein